MESREGAGAAVLLDTGHDSHNRLGLLWLKAGDDAIAFVRFEVPS